MAVMLEIPMLSVERRARRREAVVVLVQGAELLPLLGRQDAADGEGHLCVGFLKVGPRGGNVVNGGKHRALVGTVGFQQGFQLEFFLL